MSGVDTVREPRVRRSTRAVRSTRKSSSDFVPFEPIDAKPASKIELLKSIGGVATKQVDRIKRPKVEAQKPKQGYVEPVDQFSLRARERAIEARENRQMQEPKLVTKSMSVVNFLVILFFVICISIAAFGLLRTDIPDPNSNVVEISTDKPSSVNTGILRQVGGGN